MLFLINCYFTKNLSGIGRKTFIISAYIDLQSYLANKSDS